MWHRLYVSVMYENSFLPQDTVPLITTAPFCLKRAHYCSDVKEMLYIWIRTSLKYEL